jgi:hypothetical protein
VNIHLFNKVVVAWICLAVVVFILLRFIRAPYGRHNKGHWGIGISNRTAWFLMEFPALIVLSFLTFTGTAEKNITVWILTLCFIIHYFHRSVIYPFKIRTKGKTMPLAVVLMAVFFNIVNGGIIGYYNGSLQRHFDPAWLSDPRFLTGIILFFSGMVINISSDEKLIRLRKNGETGYLIPDGGLFRFVSCPNFLGEMIEWFGYALMSWSLPAWSFFIWTFCNLVPRALDHHRWYRKSFPAYPPGRKAVIPFIL